MMQIAEVLSDLTSLRVCGPQEALDLVHASRDIPAVSDPSSIQKQSVSSTRKSEAKTKSRSDDVERDPDLSRVYDLMELRKMVEQWQPEEKDDELQKAREMVQDLIHDAERKK
ncbi:MAG: hypothetical protein M1837_004526 [Sclerophora amabilis]|nr:MAG: hypothetical protein M1837_004526 [Sclerophora amabilis]